MSKYEIIKNYIVDVNPLNYLILYRKKGIFSDNVYGFIVEDNEIDLINEEYNPKAAIFKYCHSFLGTSIKYFNRDICEVNFNLNDFMKIKYDETILKINKYSNNIFLSLEQDDKMFEYKSEDNFFSEYKYLTTLNTLNSVKNKVIKSNEEHLFESVKFKNNILVCACNSPINTLYGFLIGVKLFGC